MIAQILGSDLSQTGPFPVSKEIILFHSRQKRKEAIYAGIRGKN